MKIKTIKILKSDERGVIYDCDTMNYISRKKGTISADHTHDECEIFYLVSGEIELTVGNETQLLKAPQKIEIEGNIYHKLYALTDIELLYLREKK